MGAIRAKSERNSENICKSYEVGDRNGCESHPIRAKCERNSENIFDSENILQIGRNIFRRNSRIFCKSYEIGVRNGCGMAFEMGANRIRSVQNTCEIGTRSVRSVRNPREILRIFSDSGNILQIGRNIFRRNSENILQIVRNGCDPCEMGAIGVHEVFRRISCKSYEVVACDRHRNREIIVRSQRIREGPRETFSSCNGSYSKKPSSGDLERAGGADKKSTTIGVEMDPIRAKSERNRTKSERNSENGEKSLKIFCKSWERIRSNRIRSVRNGRGIGVRNGCDPCEIREKF